MMCITSIFVLNDIDYYGVDMHYFVDDWLRFMIIMILQFERSQILSRGEL